MNKHQRALAAARAAQPPVPDVQTCILPVPPSTNKHLLIGLDNGSRKPRLFNTKEHRDYKHEARGLMGKLRPFPKPVPVTVEMVWWQSEGSEGDLDNRVKAALDALKGSAFADDRQVRRLVVEVDQAPGKVGYLEVTIRRRASWTRTLEERGIGAEP